LNTFIKLLVYFSVVLGMYYLGLYLRQLNLFAVVDAVLIVGIRVLSAIVGTGALIAVLHFGYWICAGPWYYLQFKEKPWGGVYCVLIVIGAVTMVYSGCKTLLFWIPDSFPTYGEEGSTPLKMGIALTVSFLSIFAVIKLEEFVTQSIELNELRDNTHAECRSCEEFADTAKGWTGPKFGFICQDCIERALRLLE